MTVIEAEHPPRNTQEKVLKAKASSSTHSLAGAVSGALRDNGIVTIQAVGASAVNQAIKAIAISRGHLAVQGRDVVMTPGMENSTGNPRPGTSGGDELTRIVFRVWVVER